MRCWLLWLFCCSLVSAPAVAGQTLRIGVLGLFHPQELTLTALTEDLVVDVNGQRLILLANSHHGPVRIVIAGNVVRIESEGKLLFANTAHLAARNGGAGDFALSVPGKLTRRYRGTLDVGVKHEELVPVITIDLETAVAAAVQAESAPGTPEEALKAQAIVSRSYYVAGAGRHQSFDFCDLTHCQFLREPPPAGSPAERAAAATRGLILTYQGRPFATMFTRSCGGRTLTPAQAGLPSNAYPYFSVVCEYCHNNPVRWTRTLSREDAALLLAKGEAGRLAVDRRLGWNAVPSNTFAVRSENGQTILQGRGEGHGIGLCQRGAASMARNGANFREILNRYFPNTMIQLRLDEKFGVTGNW